MVRSGSFELTPWNDSFGLSYLNWLVWTNSHGFRGRDFETQIWSKSLDQKMAFWFQSHFNDLCARFFHLASRRRIDWLISWIPRISRFLIKVFMSNFELRHWTMKASLSEAERRFLKIHGRSTNSIVRWLLALSSTVSTWSLIFSHWLGDTDYAYKSATKLCSSYYGYTRRRIRAPQESAEECEISPELISVASKIMRSHKWRTTITRRRPISGRCQ